MATENFGLGNVVAGGGGGEFYELEPAVVLDIILDENHPIFQQQSNLQTNIDIDRWPPDFQSKKAVTGEIDYSWIGRALVRPLYSSPTAEKEKLVWAYPIESGVSEYPLVNEVVMILAYRNKYFYSRKLNIRNLPNESVDFAVNSTISGKENNELYTDQPFQGKPSKTSSDGGIGYKGVVGKYYQINDRMRRIKRYEGDTILESRFGQTIRFGAYDAVRENDVGVKNTAYSDGGGNPMIIIRNRQRKLLAKGETLKLTNSPNPATVIGTEEEKNAGGFIKEDINHDGSTIAITSGLTISGWKTTCYKKMFGTGEEVSVFNGGVNYQYPVLSGEQMVFNTNRIVISSRYGEMFHYSKKRYGIVTDSEYTLDAHQQVVLTTNTKTVINSPAIYLGEYDQTGEPAVLGQTLANWLYDLCNWIAEHTHWYIHSHPHAGSPPSPTQTQIPVQIQQLFALRDRLNTILSRRVFVTGGGFAPGQDGGTITDGTSPVKINVKSGSGVPGGWKGANKR